MNRETAEMEWSGGVALLLLASILLQSEFFWSSAGGVGLAREGMFFGVDVACGVSNESSSRAELVYVVCV